VGADVELAVRQRLAFVRDKQAAKAGLSRGTESFHFEPASQINSAAKPGRLLAIFI